MGHSNSRVLGTADAKEADDKNNNNLNTHDLPVTVKTRDTNSTFYAYTSTSKGDSNCGSSSHDANPRPAKKSKSCDSLARFPKFLAALQKDESLLIACYNAFNDIDYLSDGVYKVMGYDAETPRDELSFPVTPFRGSTFFRQRPNGSLVQFNNTFKAQLPSGEVYSIDEYVHGAKKSNLIYLLVHPTNGEVTSCEGSCTSFGDTNSSLLIGKHFFELISAVDVTSVMTSLERASEMSCSYNITTIFKATSSISVKVSMDIIPCCGKQEVVILLSPSSEVSSCCDDGMGTVSHVKERRAIGPLSLSSSDDFDFPICKRENSIVQRLIGLHRNINFLSDFVNNVAIPMLSVSNTGDIVWANDAMLDMMGFSGISHTFLGTKAIDYHVDHALQSKMFTSLQEGSNLVDVPCSMRRRNGEEVQVIYSSNGKFENGTFSYSRCVIHDVKANSPLGKQWEDSKKRKDQLVLAELKEKEAVAASKTKSDFLAVMSHELRTPINGVLGATSLLGTTTLNEEQQDYVNTITDSADILLSLISNILDISKIENGKLELEKVPLRMVDMVRKCADMMKFRASEKGLTITTHIDPGLNYHSIWHRGDPTRINQVLLNFMSNAVKFTSSGGIQCKLMKIDSVGDECMEYTSRSCSSQTSSSTCMSSSTCYDWLRLEVIDTGCGISNTVNLFAPFVQANKSIHKKYGGTGLGLNISKQIVALMKGRVGIDSVEGVGTTVWAEIPLRQAPAPRKGPSFTKGSPMPTTAITTRTRSDSSRAVMGPNNEDLTKRVRILIVEDNMVNQKLLKKLLQTLGYSDITVTSDGQEAVNAVKQSWEKYFDDPCCGRYDIVLMDCLMPVMDGWVATKQIKDLEAECLARSASRALQVPIYSEAQPTIILALTANATSEDEQKCNECGMDDYYIKPMPRDGLNAMMLHWVSKLFAETSCEIDEGI